MKATDYADKFQQYQAADLADAEVQLALLITTDLEDLRKKRFPQSNEAISAIFKETYQKFQKARIIEKAIPEWVFHVAVKGSWPMLYDILLRDGILPEIHHPVLKDKESYGVSFAG